MTEFAYIRVSAKDQNENRQIDALEAFLLIKAPEKISTGSSTRKC